MKGSEYFWRLLEQSVLISGALALSLTVTACYMWASGRAVPQELYAVLGVIVGFFFGARSQKQASSD